MHYFFEKPFEELQQKQPKNEDRDQEGIFKYIVLRGDDSSKPDDKEIDKASIKADNKKHL